VALALLHDGFQGLFCHGEYPDVVRRVALDNSMPASDPGATTPSRRCDTAMAVARFGWLFRTASESFFREAGSGSTVPLQMTRLHIRPWGC
jgi:hypothetical protein